MKLPHRLIPISLIIIAIPLALMVVFFLLAVIFTHDEPRPDDSSLLLPKVAVADKDNAFIEMQRIENAKSFSSEPDMKLSNAVSNLAENEAYAASMIKQHANEIALFRQAAAKSQYQDPVYADPASINLETETFPIYSSYRQAAQVVALEAEILAKNGDIKNGLDEAVEVVSFGHKMETGQGAIIAYLVGSSIKQIGLTALRQIALNSSITAAQIKEVEQRLEAFRDSRSGQSKAMKMEYMAYKNYLQKYSLLGPLLGSLSLTSDASGKTTQQDSRLGNFLDYSGLTTFYYRPNQTWRYKIKIISDGVQNAEADCAIVDANPPRSFPVLYPNITWIFKPNAIGQYLISIGEISLGGLSTKRCNESIAISATQATLAVRAFNADNGRLPTSLAEMVPQYLAGVPKDPYNGQPLSYSAEHKLLYSIGPDRKDRGGSPVSNDWQYSDNPSFAISK